MVRLAVIKERHKHFFTSVFTRENTDSIPDLEPERDIKILLEDLIISPGEVKKKLEKLNPAKSPGPDQMHPRVLKELSEQISIPLAHIMNKSIEEGFLPQCWKDAHVFQKGCKIKHRKL